MNFGIGLNLIFVGILTGLLLGASPSLTTLLVTNTVVQLVLFALVTLIPFLRTGRVSYVDIAWPFGVALIGLQAAIFADGDVVRRAIVGLVYLFIGLRMGLGALVMASKTGVIFKTEFPRYQYRKVMLEQAGSKHSKLHLFSEILAQGMANATVLAIPAFIIAGNASSGVATWEWLGLVLWAIAYGLESVADAQKLHFMKSNKGGVCNIGLWKFSRHPNYFAEWLVWSGIVVAAIPSWWAMATTESFEVWLLLGVASIAASGMLYITLVYLTGAKPAEYFSVQKRPAYRDYQASTNMFFPWLPKK